MKKLHKIVFLILALISVGLMGWAMVAGIQAPDSGKIADIMGMTYQYDESGEEMQDTLGNPIPVITTEQGIVAMGTATVNQMRKSDATIYGSTLEKIKNIENKIAEIEKQIASNDTKELKDAEAKVTQLTFKRRRTPAENAELEAAKKKVEELKNLPKTLEELKAKCTWDANATESAKVIALAETEFKAVQEQVKKANEAIEAKKAQFDPAKKLVEDVCKAANIKLSEVEGRTDYVATLDELLASRDVNSVQKRQLGLNKAIIAEYQKLANEQKTAIDNETAYEANIPMLKDAIAQAELDQVSIQKFGKVISYNIYWTYFLIVFAIVFAIVGFILNFFQNAGNWVITIVSAVVIVAVVVAAYYISAGHGWLDGTVLYVTNEVGQAILDANGQPIPFGLGTDPETRFVFGEFEYMIADVGIWITYLAFIGAALAAVYSAVRGIFKS